MTTMYMQNLLRYFWGFTESDPALADLVFWNTWYSINSIIYIYTTESVQFLIFEDVNSHSERTVANGRHPQWKVCPLSISHMFVMEIKYPIKLNIPKWFWGNFPDFYQDKCAQVFIIHLTAQSA